MRDTETINRTKKYRRVSSGEILTGDQVIFQLEMITNPALKPALQLDIEEIGQNETQPQPSRL